MAATSLPLELWEGTIPAMISLCPEDVTALTSPEPIFVMIPRMGYLANIVQTVIECFQDSIPYRGSNHEIWFDCLNQPLNWQLPAGVLFDMCSQGEGSSECLPWNLVAHFQSFPSTILVPCNSEKTFEQHYFHSLKQGLYLQHGSSATAMSLELKDQQQLWESVMKVDPGSFHSVDKRLHGVGTARPVAVPVRLVFPTSCTTPPVVVQPLCQTTSPRTEEGGPEAVSRKAPITIGDLLQQHALVVTNGEVSTVNLPVSAIAHGVRLPLSAPLEEIWSAMSHPDHFLYIVVCPTESP